MTSMLPVSCRFVTGKEIRLSVQEDCTVAGLKREIECHEGIPAAHVRLVFAAKCLDDDASLQSCGVWAVLGGLHAQPGAGGGPVPAVVHVVIRVTDVSVVFMANNVEQRVAVPVFFTERVVNFKEKLVAYTGVPMSEQQLMTGGGPLADHSVVLNQLKTRDQCITLLVSNFDGQNVPRYQVPTRVIEYVGEGRNKWACVLRGWAGDSVPVVQSVQMHAKLCEEGDFLPEFVQSHQHHLQVVIQPGMNGFTPGAICRVRLVYGSNSQEDVLMPGQRDSALCREYVVDFKKHSEPCTMVVPQRSDGCLDINFHNVKFKVTSSVKQNVSFRLIISLHFESGEDIAIHSQQFTVVSKKRGLGGCVGVFTYSGKGKGKGYARGLRKRQRFDFDNEDDFGIPPEFPVDPTTGVDLQALFDGPNTNGVFADVDAYIVRLQMALRAACVNSTWDVPTSHGGSGSTLFEAVSCGGANSTSDHANANTFFFKTGDQMQVPTMPIGLGVPSTGCAAPPISCCGDGGDISSPVTFDVVGPGTQFSVSAQTPIVKVESGSDNPCHLPLMCDTQMLVEEESMSPGYYEDHLTPRSPMRIEGDNTTCFDSPISPVEKYFKDPFSSPLFIY